MGNCPRCLSLAYLHLLRSVQARFVRVIFEGCMIYRNGGDLGHNKYRDVIIFLVP